MYTPRTKQHRGDSLLTSWQAGLAEVATDKPWLASEAARHGDTILPRFAHFRAKLQALPRRTRRALQRKLSMTLAGVALMLALGSEPVSAAIIDVDGLNCTLIDAIVAANTDAATAGCPAGSGADTLVLSPGSTHTLDSVYTDFNGPTGLPVITSEIRMEGNGATIARQGTAPEFRIMAVDSANLILDGVTITGGRIDDNQGGGLFTTRARSPSTVPPSRAIRPQDASLTSIAPLTGVAYFPATALLQSRIAPSRATQRVYQSGAAEAVASMRTRVRSPSPTAPSRATRPVFLVAVLACAALTSPSRTAPSRAIRPGVRAAACKR